MKMKTMIGELLAVGAALGLALSAEAALTYNVTISSTSWVTVASGKTFAELGFPTAGRMGGSWYPTGGNAMPYFADSSAMTVQMQSVNDGYLKVVKLQFRDSAGSLQAKVVWCRNKQGAALETNLESSYTAEVTIGNYTITSLTFSPPANTVTFNFQGGSGGTEQVKASHGAAMPAATMPTKASYAFLGYFDAATGGTKYYNADGSSAKTWDKTSALTLYAQWMDCSSWTELSGSTSGKTLSTGCYFIRENTTFSNATAGGSGLSIADKAIVYIYIPSDVTLTATGAAGAGRTGGGAGIFVPSTATLNLIGSGKVVATGGKAADGSKGGTSGAVGSGNMPYVATYTYWNVSTGAGGAGGAGGGGGGAGIGTTGGIGGIGGTGGTRLSGESVVASYTGSGYVKYGYHGSAGSAGAAAADMGTLCIQSGLAVVAKGGEASGTGGAVGDTGSSCATEVREVRFSAIQRRNARCSTFPGAGGGGGGSGYQGADIGKGGGGGGGGSGGQAGGLELTYGDPVWPAALAGCGGTGKVTGTGTTTSRYYTNGYSGGYSGFPQAGGSGAGVGTAKAAGTAEAPVYAVAYLDKDGKACGSATYAFGSTTTITLPAAETGYGWVNTVYGKPCGEPSDLSVASDAVLTGTINARNVYGDLTFKAEAKAIPVGGDVKVKVDDEWIKKNGLEGETDEQIAEKLNETDTTGTGLRKWQNWALGVKDGEPAEKPAFTGAAKSETKGKVTLTLPGYKGNEKSGVSVSRKLVKTVGANVTETDLALEATAVEVDKGDVSAANPVALYTTVIAFSNANGAEVKSENTVGVMYVKTPAQKAMVAVPWEQIGGGEISAADLIDTRDLENGDELHVYDKANGRYKTWTLKDGAWSPLGTHKIEAGKVSELSAGDPGEATIARGDGVWLERVSTENPFHLIGQYNAEKVTLPSESGWNICGNAGIEKANVSDLGAGDGDIIIVPTEAAPVRYTKKDGAWGCYKEEVKEKTVGSRTVKVKTSEWEVGGTVGVGQGFWLVK